MALIDPDEKALKINLDKSIYGSFAEIGAGQEVARHFFRVGAAAGTVAKTMSAYDMAMSDAIYGKERSGRYVCESRLKKMLSHEYKLLETRLTDEKYEGIKFFVFADTVAAKAYGSDRPGHGWLGLKFQHEDDSAPSWVHLHVHLYDNQNYLQQEVLGRIGVNLIYACFYYLGKREKFIESLMDDLNIERVEIDMIRVEGEAFKNEDPRLFNLELIKRQYSQAVMFDESGKVCQPSEVLYKKMPLVLRGSFRPPTFVNFDMMKQGLAAIKDNTPKGEHKKIIVIPEISMAKFLERGMVENEDFLTRVDLLNALGQKVLITNKESFSELNSYLMELTRETISFVVGIYNLQHIFDPKSYSKHPHGELMAIGELFSKRTQMFVYPGRDEDSKQILTAENTKISSCLNMIRAQLLEQGKIKNIPHYNPRYFTIWSREVVKMIENCESGWEKMVPKLVANAVKKKSLFGHFCKIK